MGLKEKSQLIKGRALMTSFAAAGAIDTTMTAIAINHFDAKEINPFGGAELMRNLDQAEVFILKTAVSAILIGLYALTSIHEPKLKIKSAEIKGKYVMENALQSGNILAWGVVAWNSVSLTPDIIKAVLN